MTMRIPITGAPISVQDHGRHSLMSMQRPTWLIIALLGISVGISCAGPPVQPPSPARELDITSLLALKTPEHEHYYVLVFGAQLPVRIPRYTHSWVTVVRTTEAP